MEKKGIISYDGVCNLCNYAMRFIIKNGGARHYQFTSLQSDLGKQTIDAYGISEKAMSTVILFENEKIYLRSTAILRIIRKLKGPVKMLYVFILIPPFIRNFLYNVIATNRYKWFGKTTECGVD